MGSAGSSSPVPTVEMLENENFFLKLIQENGRPDVVSAKLEENVTGGYSKIARKCYLELVDGTKVTAMVKIAKNDFMTRRYGVKLGLHREGNFYQMSSSLDHHIGDA